MHWTKRYIFFHGKRHPAETGALEVTEFLTALATHLLEEGHDIRTVQELLGHRDVTTTESSAIQSVCKPRPR